MEEYVTLVDASDRVVGREEKLKAHQEAKLHRACSVVLLNSNGEMLLQKRHPSKYHSGGLWSNTCCTHPRPGESPHAAAVRRLDEEMGIASDLTFLFGFVYRAELDAGLTEYEFDHVFGGRFEGDPTPNGLEVSAWKWLSIGRVARDVEARPDEYTRWFPLLMNRLTGGERPYDRFLPFQVARPDQ